MPRTEKTQLTLHQHICDPNFSSKNCGRSCYYNLFINTVLFLCGFLFGGGVCCCCLDNIICAENFYCVRSATDGVVPGAVIMRLGWGGEGEICMLEITNRMCYYIREQRGCRLQIVFNPSSDTLAALDCCQQ